VTARDCLGCRTLLAKPLFGANAMSMILPIAVFPSLYILLRTANQNRETWKDDLNELRRDSGPIQEHFARNLFLTMIVSGHKKNLLFELRPLRFVTTGSSFQPLLVRMSTLRQDCTTTRVAKALMNRCISHSASNFRADFVYAWSLAHKFPFPVTAAARRSGGRGSDS
jgi:hypothetical protein